MRLLIIGALGGQIGAASQIAVARGSQVSQAENIAAAMKSLRAGNGADVIMIDSDLDIAGLVSMLESERIDVPSLPGVGDDKGVAVRAIKSGAQEYIPLPPDAELIQPSWRRISRKLLDHPQRPSHDEGVGIGQTGCKARQAFWPLGTRYGQGINGPIYP